MPAYAPTRISLRKSQCITRIKILNIYCIKLRAFPYLAMTVYVKVMVTAEKNCNFKMRTTTFKVPEDMTLGVFVFELRKHLIPALSEFEALFMMIQTKQKGHILCPTSTSMGTLSYEHKDTKDILHMVLCRENVFGF
jgi:hypothetical protein